MTSIPMSNRIELIAVDAIKPYEHNPRRIGEDAIAAVEASIRSFGFRVPILLDEQGIIIAGHTRWLAAKKIGLREIPAIVLRDLTKEQAAALRIADNRSAEFSDWDTAALDAELARIERELPDLLRELEALDISALTAPESDATQADRPASHHAGSQQQHDGDNEDQDEAADIDDDMQPSSSDDASERTKQNNKAAMKRFYTDGLIPVYRAQEPHPPPLTECWNDDVYRRMLRVVDAYCDQARPPEDLRAFLLAAASRFYDFRFDRIAEYYCHADDALKRVFEELLLVISDRGGFIAEKLERLHRSMQRILHDSVPNKQASSPTSHESIDPDIERVICNQAANDALLRSAPQVAKPDPAEVRPSIKFPLRDGGLP